MAPEILVFNTPFTSRTAEILVFARQTLLNDSATPPGSVHIYQQATEVWGQIRIKKPKTKNSVRTIDLTEKVVSCLREHLAWLDKTGLSSNPIVFPNQDGTYLRRGTFTRWSWKKWLKAANLPHRGFHHLRHTAATLMLISGVEVPVVTEILGHGSQKTTLDIYGHILTGRRDRARIMVPESWTG